MNTKTDIKTDTKTDTKIELLTPGSYVNYRSLRNDDLIPAFMIILRNYDKDLHDQYLMEIGQLLLDDPDQDIWDDIIMIEFCFVLQDELSKFCPDNYYFGAHTGNGSDFGVWPCDDIDYDIDYDIDNKKDLKL